MKKKVLFGYDYTDNECIKIILYLLVGGTAALIEWGLFFILFNSLPPDMALRTAASTAASFVAATVYHYRLANVFVFVSGSRYGKGRELSLVFTVSAVGLLLNILLMHIFVDVLDQLPLLSKMSASVIVVGWNYWSRKKWIFGSRDG